MNAAVIELAFSNAIALERATVYPWVVTATFRKADGSVDLLRVVLQAPMHAPPAAEDLLPADAVELLRADIFPATRFDDMSGPTRDRYRAEYREFLLWRKALAKGIAVAQLEPWVEYDPIELDARVYRWARCTS